MFVKSRGKGSWPRWEDYKVAITTKFRANPLNDSFTELLKLMRCRTVEQYKENFDSLLNRVELLVNMLLLTS